MKIIIKYISLLSLLIVVLISFWCLCIGINLTIHEDLFGLLYLLCWFIVIGTYPSLKIYLKDAKDKENLEKKWHAEIENFTKNL